MAVTSVFTVEMQTGRRVEVRGAQLSVSEAGHLIISDVTGVTLALFNDWSIVVRDRRLSVDKRSPLAADEYGAYAQKPLAMQHPDGLDAF